MTTSQRSEILFIDANVSDKQSLLAGISPDLEVVLLDNKTNVLNQIAAALDGRQNLDAIHIFSHGAAGELAFANGTLTNVNINDYAPQLKRIGSALSANGDLLLYGCDVAKGDSGLAFINQLSALTGADVAASDDLTGNSFAGANWILESNVGSVEADALVKSDVVGFGGTLTAGIIITNVSSLVGGYGDYPAAVLVQPDGKLVAAGFSNNGSNEDFAVVRYSSSGALDTNFGGSGIVTTAISSSRDFAYSAALQTDDKILAVGGRLRDGASYSGNEYDFAIARYKSDGSLDTGFDSDGKVTTTISFSAIASSVAVQTDGKIVVGAMYVITGYGDTNSKFTLARYNDNGSLDSNFGSSGIVSTSVNNGGGINSVLVQPDGKILAAGFSYSGGNSDFTVVRYNTDGSLDTNFDSDGKVSTNLSSIGDAVNSVALQSDGKILVAGYSYVGSTNNTDFALVRYNTDGSLDTNFDGDGIVSANFNSTFNVCNSVKVQSDGKILVAGYSRSSSMGYDLALARYNSNGSLDTTFDGDGKVTTAISSSIDVATSVAIQADGKIVVTGYSGADGINAAKDFALVRYNADGSLDSTFTGVDTTPPVQTPPTGNVTINGTSQQNQTLTASNTLADVNGLGQISYQWFSNGAAVSTQNSYVLTQSDVGKTISVTASYTDGLGKLESVTSSATSAVANVNDLPTGSVSISGTPTQGQTLTATNSLADLDGLGSISYQWLSNGAVISGATNSTYSLTQTEVGKTISVRASYTDLQNTTESVTSSATASVLAGAGIIITNVSSLVGANGDAAYSVLIQPDGKIVAAGFSHHGSNDDFAVVRYNSNGSLDSSFGGDGIVTTAIGGLGYSVALQTDGKIVVTGVQMKNGAAYGADETEFALVRYNTDGSLDTSFDGDGKVATAPNFTSAANSVAIQADGKIIAAGSSHNGDGNPKFTLARYNNDGSLDTSFDGDGMVVTTVNYGGVITSIVMQPDSKILAAGYSRNSSGIWDFTVVRYNTDGSLDTSFDGDGKVSTALGSSSGQSVTLQSDGKILVAGASASNTNFAIVRYNSNGSLDTSFDGDGVVSTSFNSTENAALSVTVQPNGKIVVSGYTGNDSTGRDFALARYNSDGSLDTSFDGDGKVTTVMATAYDFARSVKVQTDGKIVVAGLSGAGGFRTDLDVVSDFTVVRYNADGSLDSAFNGIGVPPPPPPVQFPPTGSVTINGTSQQNQTLTVSNTLADANGLGQISYQWFSNGAAVSTQNSYALTQSDVGKTISVTASYTDGLGKLESVTSSATASVANVNDLPTGSVTISGTPAQGQTLTATNSLADLDGLGSITYQWLSNGAAISGATSPTYTLTQAEVGKTLSVKASYIDLQNTAESVTSSATASVANANDLPSGSVIISGTPAQGQTLTASNTLADLDGFGSITYQWLSNGAVISGATQNTYTLTTMDVNKAISVRASYVDSQNTPESVTSSATTLVAAPQTPPTGGVLVDSAPPQQNETLTVSNTLADANGLGAISYQWFSNGVAMSGKTQTTYTLLQTDVGKTLSVIASYTDGLGKLETVTSNAVTISNINDLPTGSVTINGTVMEEQVLTASNTLADLDGLGTISYQWLSNGAVISGATSSTYTLTQADVGKTIKVVASYVDGFGKLESVASSETAGVANINDLPTGTVKISGTPTQGQILTASNSLADLDGLGAIGYQWLSNGVVISGATQPSYTLTQTEVGKSISVKASYTDLQNTAESVISSATAAVANVNDLPTGSVTISGIATEDQTLTASNTLADLDGLGTITYQWLSNGAAISGATSPTYTLTQAEVSKSVSVKASYSDGFGTLESVTSSSVTIANVNDSPTGIVSISGTPTQGQILTATNTLADLDGLGSISYQWLIGGNAISGATSSTYTLTQNEVGKNLSVKASYSDGFGKVESVTSSTTAAVANVNDLPMGSLTITGTPAKNQVLTATNNSIDDLDGLGAISYQWFSNDTPISSATEMTYKLTSAEVDKKIKVVASYTDGFGTAERLTSPATIAVIGSQVPPTGKILVDSAPPQQNQTLTVSPDTLADANGLGTISYQWLSNGVPISGKTQTTYTLTQADVGKTLSVVANYTDGLGKLETVTSNVVTITNINDSPTGSVLISGTPTEGQTLTASNSLADLDGLGAISYQWFSNATAIPNATATTYTLTQAEVNKTIKVSATYTDGFGKLESIASSSTKAVANVNNLPTGSVSISGTPTQGQTLTATNTLEDLDGLGTINYQWLRDGSVISGATKNTYTLDESDIGKTISVRASYTDLQKTPENVTSAAAELVSEFQAPPTGSVTISGVAKQNQTLTANNNLVDANGLGEIRYQWSRDGTAIADETQKTYTLTQSDVNKKISVTASYTDGLGKPESVTSDATDNVINVNDAPTGSVSISGTLTQGQTLTATNNSIADLDGLGTFHYQWRSDGVVIAGATQATYQLTKNEVAEKMSVEVSYTDGGGKLETVSSSKTDVVKAINHKPTGDVKIDGKAEEKQTLTISQTLKDADGLGEFSYQWLRAGSPILGATSETYTLTKDDIGKKISITISYTDDLNFFESKTSSATDVIKKAVPIVKTGTPQPDLLIGAELNDTLKGLAGADTLRGNAGNDLLDGGNGNDLLEGGNGNDKLLGGDGNDTLIASSGNDSLDGGKGNDKLQGDAGNDTLNGGVGQDKMEGGDGRDYYYVDNKGDTVTETNNITKSGGIDTIETTLNYTLPKNVENLILKDTKGKGVSGTGNDSGNVISGSIGDDSLNGMAGNDKLNGGDGADTLDGGKSVDSLTGGNGNDVYFMNNDGDIIIETAKGGEQDQIISSVSFDLTQTENIENLMLSDKATDGTGNARDNLIQGNTENNSLSGGSGDDIFFGQSGDDTLEGGAGNDTLDGGDGNDIAIFSGESGDYQLNRNPDAEGVDEIVVTYRGTDDKIKDASDTLTNIEILQFADGETLNTRDLPIEGGSSGAMLILIGVTAIHADSPYHLA